MKIFILIMFCLLIGFLAGKSKSSIIYDNGYQAGFDKGLDTANVLMDKSFDSLMNVMRADQKEVETMISDLGAFTVESFPNHSEIK